MILMMTPRTCKAARALLDWKQPDLAEKSGVGLTTIVNFEKGKGATNRGHMLMMQEAFEKEGVRFIHDAAEVGVAKRGDE